MAKKPTKTTISTREQLEGVFGEYCSILIEYNKQQLSLEEQITELRTKYEAPLTELKRQVDELYNDMMAWASLNLGEFGDKKRLDLIHGSIGFRSGTPAVKQLTGVKVEYTLGLVQTDPDLQIYTREKVELDKERILGDFQGGKLTVEDLRKVGLRIERQESFYVSPAKEGGGE